MNKRVLAEVEYFIIELKRKLLTSTIIYVDRDKNYKTLLRLGITDMQRNECIQKLVAEDYVSGPLEDHYDGMPLWVFGKQLRGKEIYIKIQINIANKPVICISFHIAEYRLVYPLK